MRSALGIFACILAGALAAAAQQSSEITELNIAHEVITEKDFHRAKELRVAEGDLVLKAGAAASASEIRLTLMGVRGRIRFRAVRPANLRKTAPRPAIR